LHFRIFMCVDGSENDLLDAGPYCGKPMVGHQDDIMVQGIGFG